MDSLPLEEQLREFADAELYLIDDPTRRGLSKLLTATFLMDIEFGKATRGQYQPHADFIDWMKAVVYYAPGDIRVEDSRYVRLLSRPQCLIVML